MYKPMSLYSGGLCVDGMLYPSLRWLTFLVIRRLYFVTLHCVDFLLFNRLKGDDKIIFFPKIAISFHLYCPNLDLKYVSKINALNFEIVAVSRSYIRFFMLRYRFKALTE